VPPCHGRCRVDNLPLSPSSSLPAACVRPNSYRWPPAATPTIPSRLFEASSPTPPQAIHAEPAHPAEAVSLTPSSRSVPVLSNLPLGQAVAFLLWRTVGPLKKHLLYLSVCRMLAMQAKRPGHGGPGPQSPAVFDRMQYATLFFLVSCPSRPAANPPTYSFCQLAVPCLQLPNSRVLMERNPDWPLESVIMPGRRCFIHVSYEACKPPHSTYHPYKRWSAVCVYGVASNIFLARAASSLVEGVLPSIGPFCPGREPC